MAYVVKNPAGKFLAQAFTPRPKQVDSAKLATRFGSLASATDYVDQKHKRSRRGGTWAVWDTDKLAVVYSVTGAAPPLHTNPAKRS